MESRLMTIDELAEVLNVPRSWIYQRTHRGASDPIPYIKVGRLLRFRMEAVEEWLAANQARWNDDERAA